MPEPLTPAQLGDAAAEAIRSLNHATQSTRPGWEYPADAYSVVGELRTMTQRLPQLLGQVDQFLHALADGDHIRSDRGGDGATEVAAVRDGLNRAAADAEALTAALDTVHSALNPLGWKD